MTEQQNNGSGAPPFIDASVPGGRVQDINGSDPAAGGGGTAGFFLDSQQSLLLPPDLVETLCLGQLSNLEQLEGPWVELMSSGDPESVATALRLFQSHLLWTAKQIGATLVINEATAALDEARVKR